jgi:hypothetical protein
MSVARLGAMGKRQPALKTLRLLARRFDAQTSRGFLLPTVPFLRLHAPGICSIMLGLEDGALVSVILDQRFKLSVSNSVGKGIGDFIGFDFWQTAVSLHELADRSYP